MLKISTQHLCSDLLRQMIVLARTLFYFAENVVVNTEDAAGKINEVDLPIADDLMLPTTKQKDQTAETLEKRANPADLLNLLKITNTISNRATLNVLALIKMGLDFSSVKPRDITHSSEQNGIAVNVIRCRKCDLVGADCTQDW